MIRVAKTAVLLLALSGLSIAGSASQKLIDGFAPMCAFSGGIYCLTHSPQNVQVSQQEGYVVYDLRVAGQDMRITEYSTFPEVRVIPEAFWRMTYLRNKKTFTVLVEQRLAGKTWWDFYLIGDTPTLQASFQASRETEIWPLVDKVSFDLHWCVANNGFPACSRLNILRQMVKGHLQHKDSGMSLKPNIRATFQYVVDTCALHFAQECVQY
ncbi:MAG: hypothetical protein JJ850_11050 [Kordiimonadaceae bacterium]|nr:hypothetical protein [Kordiimonadaceae bacterium]MBO6568877.1 hypothetical protein [Kordiimonadaceae bacterium]MBO6965148.1 hypothetical protein [Kordiimonadaceae bacterium]